METLKSICTILYYGNKGQNPRLTEALIEEFIDDLDTDIDDLFEEVMGFFERVPMLRSALPRRR